MFVNISAQPFILRVNMPRKEIFLIRAAQAKPFFETASRLGAPVKALARHAGIPIKAVRSGEGVIGEHSLWRFVELSAQHLGIDHFGYLTAVDHPINQTGQLGGLEITLAHSLREILEIFSRDVMTESDICDYGFTTQNGETWFKRELAFKDHGASWLAEQYVLTFIIQIIRLCAPGDWLPRQMRVGALQTPIELPPEWTSIDVEWGSPRTELHIDNEVLRLPPRLTTAPTDFPAGRALTQRNSMLIEDLVDRQIWTGRQGMENAARELGMSAATFKRRLATLDTSYSEILLERRLFHATRLLVESDLRVGKIAKALGYSAVSSFSRAFHTATGSSPMSLRNLRLKQK